MSVKGQNWGDVTAMTPRAGRSAHLMLVEIAGFSALRRLLGIARTDLLALDVAERIAATLTEAVVATAGRNLVEVSFASDCPAEPQTSVDAIRRAFATPVLVDGESHRLHLSIGSASTGAGTLDDVLLVEEAERGLDEARRTPVPAPNVAGDQLARDLHQAIERDELFVQYQPKLHLRQQKITSVEALIRWSHPQQGLVLPGDFIPAAEHNGSIAALTLWTIRQVIADQRVLARTGHQLPIFINMAGALLCDSSFVDQVITLIVDSGAKLGIEITETSVIRDPEGAIRNLHRLAEIGAVITIDDYGAGLSSLAYLKQLPAKELKIDKLFVTQLTSSHRDPLIVRSTIDLAHALDMEVVAEGVETASSLALLAVMGCDMAQGFLISRPLTLDALIPFLFEEEHLATLTAQRSPQERLAALRARG